MYYNRERGDHMAISDKVKGLLSMSGKKQIELAEFFGMKKQTMNNKMGRGSWSGNDLARVAEFCGCKLAFIMPDGTNIYLTADADTEKTPDA